MTISELYQIYLQYPSVQTDTRQLQAGDIFFALKGPNFNGNKFAKQAIESGAAFAVIDEKEFEIPGKTILVDDVLSSLQQLAKEHRLHLEGIPFLAITGSNGKTTTKELIHAVLSKKFRTYTTTGNLNNHIGVPLTILKIRKDAEMAIIEMGANHQKEIAGYCTYALPNYGLITNCGKAHLEGFGGVEGIRKGKGELFDHLRAQGGTAFIMDDYDYLQEMSRGIPRIIRYGTRHGELTGEILRSEPFAEVRITGGAQIDTIRTQLVGDYNLPNILAAVTLGKYFGVPDADIKAAIEEYAPSNSRSQLVKKDSNTIILDAYNANPSSMRLAIENFARSVAGKKILVLGAMAEMGEESRNEHQAIIDLIGSFSWDQVLLVGEEFRKIDHPYHQFNDATEAGKWLQEYQPQNTSLLVKGSRSMRMENSIFETSK